MGARCATLCGTLVLSLVWASPAAAQRWSRPAGEPDADAMAEARRLYQLGTEAVEGHRWSDGLAYFEESYALSGVHAALYSIAFTLRVLGRVRDSRDAFDQLMSDHPDLPDELRVDAERYRQEVASRVSVLAVAGIPEAPTPSVTFDGAAATDDGARPLVLETDPGEHALRIEVEGLSPFTWQGSLERGERLFLDAVFEDEGAPAIWSSPLFWIAVGAAVVAAGVVTGIVLYEGAQLDPRTSPHIVL